MPKHEGFPARPTYVKECAPLDVSDADCAKAWIFDGQTGKTQEVKDVFGITHKVKKPVKVMKTIESKPGASVGTDTITCSRPYQCLEECRNMFWENDKMRAIRNGKKMLSDKQIKEMQEQQLQSGEGIAGQI